MSDINSAVDAIRKQARLYEPLVKVADALEKIGSLDNAKKEHEKEINLLAIEKDKLSKEVKGLKAKLEDGLANVQGAVANYVAQADTDVLAAKELSARLIADAKEKAVKIIDNANAKGDAIVLRANSELLSLNEKASNAQEATKEALELQSSAQLELDNINKKIEAAKAKVAGLLE
jgi:type VI protein secretion system component VasK